MQSYMIFVKENSLMMLKVFIDKDPNLLLREIVCMEKKYGVVVTLVFINFGKNKSSPPRNRTALS